ncbi:hypothetical protein [Streptococcus uberis]|nr:hypothetical protein [Streptococcus uberis]
MIKNEELLPLGSIIQVFPNNVQSKQVVMLHLGLEQQKQEL